MEPSQESSPPKLWKENRIKQNVLEGTNRVFYFDMARSDRIENKKYRGYTDT
jgi:hypothetical protein